MPERTSYAQGTPNWVDLPTSDQAAAKAFYAGTWAVQFSTYQLHRDAQPVIPPRVDYSLTERGRELAALLLPLVEWTVVHAEEILGPPDPA